MDVVKKEGQGTQSEEVRPESPAESEPSSDRELVDFLMSPAGYGLMGQRQQARDAVDLIKTAVDASPTGIAIVGVRGADEKAGFGKFDFQNPEPFDHVLIAYRVYNEKEDRYEYRIAEMMPGDAPDPDKSTSRLFGSPSNPGTLEDTGRSWHSFVAIPVTLTPEQDALLRGSVEKNLAGGNTYSFFSWQGDTCASGARKVLIDAKIWDWKEQDFLARLEELGINIVQPGTVMEWAAQRGGIIYDSRIYTRTASDPPPEQGEKTTQIPEGQPAADGKSVGKEGAEKETYINFKEMLQDGWGKFSENFPDAADYFGKFILELAGKEELFGAVYDVKFGMPDVVLPKAIAQEALQAWWDDFCEAFPEAAEALAKHLIETYGEPAPFGSYSFQLKAAIPIMLDKLAQPTPDGQAGSSPAQPAGVHEETANAPDTEGGHIGEVSAMAKAELSSTEGAHIGDVSVMAKAELGGSVMANAELSSNPALDGQPEPLHTASASVGPDDGFSFSLFAKPGVPAEVAKEAMPAGQFSPQDPGAGTPAGESALPDAASVDVGNAAPNKEPVVHQGDLAP
jgi:hypothetical protein